MDINDIAEVTGGLLQASLPRRKRKPRPKSRKRLQPGGPRGGRCVRVRVASLARAARGGGARRSVPGRSR